jgi:ectoine hydroxylase-related dioxygenase (phytanoyl-CoA dioxygenase family)
MKTIHEELDSKHLLNHYGYKICRSDDYTNYNDFKNKFKEYLFKELNEYEAFYLKIDDFEIKEYHTVLDECNIDHHNFIKKISRRLNVDFSNHKFIKNLINKSSKCINSDLHLYKKVIEFRVVRPNYEDNNPIHRDHWFPYYTPLLNVYIPLSGSYCDSSLAIIPFSHKWSDSDIVPTFNYDDIIKGKKHISKNGIAYSAPSIKHTSKEINLYRPDVLEGDFMLFSPLIVHGGGNNKSFETRFSIEIRLEKNK